MSHYDSHYNQQLNHVDRAIQNYNKVAQSAHCTSEDEITVSWFTYCNECTATMYRNGVQVLSATSTDLDDLYHALTLEAHNHLDCVLPMTGDFDR